MRITKEEDAILPTHGSHNSTGKSFKKIRVDYHPDRYVNASDDVKIKNTRFLNLAEDTNRRILEKK